MQPDESTQTPVPFGKYALTELIGEGDIGRVYSARSTVTHGFDKRLVVKKIRPELSEDTRYIEAFMAEARVALSLSHTNIVQVVELDEHEGLPFIVMEHVCGMNLARCNALQIQIGRRWNPLLAAFVAAEVAMGLDHAHRRRDLEGRPLGIVHQDVTPSNVLLSFEGAVKITDFGMSSVVGSERLQRAEHPRYLAPEQVRGEPVDPRTDVYGCGLLLYEMLSGRPPLHDLDREEAVERLGLGTVPVLGEETRTSIDPRLVEVLARATAAWPDERYEDAASLYEALMTTIFAAGRKIGRRDLVALMSELREADQPSEATPADDVERALGSWLAERSADSTAQEHLSYERLVTGMSEPTTVVEEQLEPAAYSPMRGRDLERQQLGDFVATAARKQAVIVELIGAEGVGKTRLVHEVVGKLRAREAPLHYFSVSCQELPKSGRFTTARTMLRQILGLGAPSVNEDIRAATRRLREFGLSQYELEAVQDVIGVGPGKAPPGPGRARAAGRGLGQILRKLGEDTLTIVFWDDADLMDADSARLLARARKHFSPTSLVVVIARSDGPSPWPEPLTTNSIELAPLDLEAMRQIICDGFAVDEVDAKVLDVAGARGGNPRFASEVVRLIDELGWLRLDQDVATIEGNERLKGLSLAQVVDARLSKRNDLERSLMELAACVGMRFEVSLLTSAMGIAAEELRPALIALDDARMLVPRASDAWAFAHPKLRARVLVPLATGELTELHRRIAETMASSEAAHDASWRLRCAGHLRDAGQRSRARDLLATSAAQLEIVGATDAAIDHFSAALELTRGTEEAPVALALGLRTATLALRCGRLREGLRAAGLAIDLARSNRNGKDEIKALVLAGRLVGAAGRIEDASNRFRAALSVAERLGDQAAHQTIRGAMGELLVQTGDYRRAVAHLENAIAGVDGPETKRFVLLAALCRGRSGDEAVARELLERIADQATSDPDPSLQTGQLFVSSLIDATAGRHQQAVESLQECRELARAHGLHHDNALAAHHLGCILLALGRPQNAFASLSYSYELAREYGFERLIRVNIVSLATLDVLHHQRNEPVARIKAALDEAREAGFLSDIIQIRFYLGQALIATGQIAEARRQLDQARRAGRATGNLLFDADIDLLLGRLSPS